MSEKPFAEAVEDERGVFRLWLDGELQGAVLLDYSQAHAMTAALNTRVEAREAKLREPMMDLQAAAVDVLPFLGPFYEGGNSQDAAHRTLLNAMDRVSRAVEGTGPDYVTGDVACGLAFDLGVTQAALRDLRVVVDALDGGVAELAPFLEAMGLRRETPLLVTQAPDGLSRIVLQGSSGYSVQDWRMEEPIIGPVEVVVRRR